MLGKLIKHEFRATGRLMLPLFLIVVVLSFFARLATQIIDRTDSTLLNILNYLLIIGFFVSLAIVAVFAVVLMISRFYKNLMTDEGYLMFTLPANIHQILWSKLLVAASWFIGTFLVIFLSIFIFAYETGMVSEMFRVLGEFFRQLTSYYAIHGVLLLLEVLLMTLVGMVLSCLTFYLPIAAGHSFANHKVLYSVLFYFGLVIVSQIVGVSALFGVGNNIPELTFTAANAATYLHGTMWCLIAGEAVSCAVLYVPTWLILKKKLNLQ